jgi:hypothetical protein
LVAAFTLTACTAQPSTPSPAPSPAPTVVPLTVAQATKAALRVADLPKGWDGGVAEDPTPRRPTPTPAAWTEYEPADCRIVVGDPLTGLGVPATAVRGQYFVREPLQSITELIYSWPAPQVSLVDRVADTLPGCARVTGTSSVRDRFSIMAKQVRVPGLEDGIAVRSEIVMADTPDNPFVDYDAVVVRGGTVLRIRSSSHALTDAAFGQLLTKAVARLDAVS